MGRRNKKTTALIEAAYVVLDELHPMTLRQVYYQLVAKQVIANRQSEYNRLSRALTGARRDGIVPWEWIVDRTRTPSAPPMWDNAADFTNCVLPQFRLDIWPTQDQYIEVWVEKDALGGIFEPITCKYGVTLCVCRGYPSASFLYEAVDRFSYHDNPVMLYWGDHDPSGMDMGRNLVDGLAEFDCPIEFVRCALNMHDIEQYNLPHDPAKKTDTRARAFIAQHGDIAVELDALPVNVLRKRITTEIEARLNLTAFEALRNHEQHERDRLHDLMVGA